MRFLILVCIIIQPKFCFSSQEIIAQKIVDECKYSLKSSFMKRRFPQSSLESDYLHYSKENDSITIRLKLHFRLESFVGDYIELRLSSEKIVRATLLEVSNYYKDYGLNLLIEPSFDISMSFRPEPPPKDAYLIYLRPDRGIYMNLMRWGLNPSWSLKARSKIYAHELTHLFGILDEYERDTLQAGFIGEEDSIMRNWSHPNGKLYPRHIKKVLEPLCPKL